MKKQSDSLKTKQQQKYQRKDTLFIKAYKYSIHCNASIYMEICLKDSGKRFILNSDNTGHLPLSAAEIVLNFSRFYLK